MVNHAMEVERLRVVRGGREVLPDLTVRIPSGSVVGLLGPSGSGKSTLIRAIVGVQVVQSGTVTVLGHPAGSPVLRDRVGYVTQAPSIYDDLTVRENVRFFAQDGRGRRSTSADRAIERGGPREPCRGAGRTPLRRPALAGLARLRAGG